MARMSAMMFLQYWPLGVWGVTVGTYIAANTGNAGAKLFSAGFIGYSTAASAVGSFVAPVVFGFLSDRYFSAQNLLALLHGGCAVAAFAMYDTSSQMAFFLWLLLYFQCFSAAAALTNKISLRHLQNSAAEYPLIRIFSTVGWISAGLFVGFAWPHVTGASIESTGTPFLIGSLGSLLMAFYCVTLPATPPDNREPLPFGRAVRDGIELMRDKQLVTFLLVSLLACVPSMAYNNFANPFLNHLGYHRPAALMTLGQLSDMIVLALTPTLIARYGLRRLFLAGVLAWVARYVLLASGSHWGISAPVYGAILVHGMCFVFVYVIGVMYVDQLVHGEQRGTAQGMYALASSGLGHLGGALTVGLAQAVYLTPADVTPPPYNWTAFWMVPAAVGAATAVAVTMLFRSK